MDVLTDLLYDLNARGAVFDHSALTPPWSLRFLGETPLTLVASLRGQGWIVPDDTAPVPIGSGDVAIVVGPRPWTVADTVTTPPRFLVRGDGSCLAVEGEEAPGAPDRDHRAPPDTEDPAVLLIGSCRLREELCAWLLDALPRVLVVPPDGPRPVMDLIVAETARHAPGRQVILDRLLDLLLVSTLREWFARPGVTIPAWYRALDDPVVGRALRLMHDDPAHPWTVAELASRSGVSRATFARRFTELLGEPPMAYLTAWRVCLAADLLTQTQDTVATIARQVGYADAFSLSGAFKRVRGVRPSEYRLAARAAPGE
ncbi:cupin domain-containing protein [Marinactinospora thermotolerans]|uniref:Transcriptional regulator, AraC family n=1 Tax=Marinactinospora thermotolerans DSM 45154 TaxID=1122192 RepID=A0A1T4RUP0_9ACTN|nr:AraC family transcriptional regulator [Marinactinospora thermotolerans]SKA19673.1 transcriptional regulator, AraC family [Marinactinospora thermotolerans DSM 45154]